MSAESYGVLIILILAVYLWVTEKIPPAVTGLLIIVLLPLFKVVEFSKAVSGFTDGSVWLLLGVFILSAAMSETGLDKRLAYSLILRGQDNAKRLIFTSVLTNVLLAFILPSATGRTALLIPILAGVIRTASLEESNVAKVLMLSVTYTAHTISPALITGALSTVYTASILEKSLNYSIGYMEWFILMFPPALLTTLLVAPIIMKIFTVEKILLGEGMKMVKSELLKLGDFSLQEKKLTALFCLMFLLWVTNTITHIPLGLSALAVGVLTFMPGISLIKWHEAVHKVDWGSIMIFGSSISLAVALQDTGTVNWLAGKAFGVMEKLPDLFIAPAILTFLMLIRIGFGSVIGFVTVMIPVAVATAITININPIWLVMIVLLGSMQSFFLPAQSPTNLPAYSTGFFKTSEMVKAGIAVTVMYIVLSTLVANLYWPIFMSMP